MGAMTLLVDRRGAELSVSSNSQAICLRYPNGEVHRVGAFALARIVIHGDVKLSAAVLRACEEAQVAIVILPGRSKGVTVNVFPNVESNFKLRFAQYRGFFDERLRLSLARKIVSRQKFFFKKHLPRRLRLRLNLNGLMSIIYVMILVRH